MRKRILSQAAWLTVLMGSVFSGSSSARAAGGPLPTADLRRDIEGALPPAPVQAPIVTVGPVYAYGPVLQTPKPRQRARKPSWGSQNNTSRDNNMRTAAPYWHYQSQDSARPWQAVPPRYNLNPRWTNTPYRYGGYPGPYWQNRQQSPRIRSQSPNALAWYDRGGRPIDSPDRVRQPNWRY
jgi:hypothetical protein